MNLLSHIIAIIVAIIVTILGDRAHTHLNDVYVPDMSQITDKIYLGNWVDSTNWDVLKKEDITHVLTLNRKRWHGEKDHERQGIKHLYICIDDVARADIAQHFDECIAFIDSADKVLVHCSAGVSRSSTIVAAYLMKQKKMGLSDAITLLRSKRPRVNPNPGFMKQLSAFSQKLQQGD
jgi:predicted protein tyrosine phosphatase